MLPVDPGVEGSPVPFGGTPDHYHRPGRRFLAGPRMTQPPTTTPPLTTLEASWSSGPAPPASPRPTSSARPGTRAPCSRPTDVVGGISQTVVARRLALRHRRPPVLHQGARGRGALARDPPRRGLPAAARARAASTTGASSTTTRSRPVNALRNLGLDRGRPLRPVVPVGAGPPAEGPDARSRATSPPTTAGGSTATSSRPTARRCGRCPPRRSRPTGAPSASRACRCGPRCGSRCAPASPGDGHAPAGHQPDRGVPVPQATAPG